jgi:hypothetical protein
MPQLAGNRIDGAMSRIDGIAQILIADAQGDFHREWDGILRQADQLLLIDHEGA